MRKGRDQSAMKDEKSPSLKEYIKSMGAPQRIIFILLLLYIISRIGYFAYKSIT
ncbi:MAG TPA: hypothetical protein VJ824_04515 [Bacillota bacterium]|nr:hypothetical protein [Bacillota bacterium]